MKKIDPNTSGLKSLVAMYRKAFHLPENLNHYTEQDFKSAERQFIKFMLQNRELSSAPSKHT
jgi:hypothetical protein